jgi:ADP-ribose pyrophosphatase YjhB (NUDIX family)
VIKLSLEGNSIPKAVSKRQYRFMMAILHGKAKSHPRGTPPKSVASKYSNPGKEAPEQSGSNTGGTWGEAHHAKAKEKSKKERQERKKSKAELKKSFEQFYKGRGVGLIVVNPEGKILVGRDAETGEFSTPGGHVEPGESFEDAAGRELAEETGISPKQTEHFMSGKWNGNDNQVFVVSSYKGRLRDTDELKDLSFRSPHEISWDKMRDCCVDPLKAFLEKRCEMKKSLTDMVALEELQKNIIRQKGEAVYEMTHGDALKVVGNGVFRFLRENVRDMKDEDFKDIFVDNHKISIRKHMSDVYSGRIYDGQKMIHQFTNRSLPSLAAELMSVFEWYLPEDEPELNLLDEKDLDDDAIEGGLNQLVEHYKKNNIANIYQEMENIREEMRHGMAIDLQQTEQKVMKLFDKLEQYVQSVADKHNDLAEEAGLEIDKLEAKLMELQSKLDEVSKRPETVEAFSVNPPDQDDVIDQFYNYLSRPSIEISPNGKIKITFKSDWMPMDKENFLKDMKAKVVKKGK